MPEYDLLDVWETWADFWRWSISVGISTLTDGWWNVLENAMAEGLA